MMNRITKVIINFVLIAIVAVSLCVGNSILFRYEQEVNTFLSPPIVDTETLELSSQTGQEMSRRIMTEGAVMLKNDGALPLSYEEVKEVNVFGWRSIDWIYGSEGQNASGGVAPENDNFEENVDIYKALNKYGIDYNARLYDMYYDYLEPDHQSANLKGVHIDALTPLKEPGMSYYSSELLEYSEAYSETAIVVIGRMAGEGMNAAELQEKKGAGTVTDYDRHYLEISTEEEALLTYCGENYENVIVLMNVANPFEMGFLDDIPGIDACLYIGFTGTRGAQAIPALLYGEVSPSGRTVDTFAYDLYTNPANVFKGELTYTDYGRTYVDYTEDIYVGYKWYETADAEGVWENETRGSLTGYDAVVQYPFGYGLSYNTYSWSVGEIMAGETAIVPGDTFTDQTKITIPVTVTNEGSVPGRDVVEVYVEVPYYGHEVGVTDAIEKPAVQLAGFGKTNVLEPGASETIEIEIDPYDFASYDCYNANDNDFSGWELERGEYTFSLRTDAHTVKTVTYDGGETAGDFVFELEETIKIEQDPVTGEKVTNKFTGSEAIDTTPLDATDKDGSFDPGIPWFSRKNFPSPEEFSALNAPRAATPSAKMQPYDGAAEKAQAWDAATGTDVLGNPIPTEAPVWGADNGLSLTNANGSISDLGKELGADYDNAKWEALLDQLEIGEVVGMISEYYGTDALSSVGKPVLTDLDGPAQIKGFNFAPRGTGYPAMVVLASTWNPELAYEFGKAFGDDMKGVSVSGLWGWAIDTHRTAWFGRNHESPSEDAFLAGQIVSGAVKGLNTRGRYCFIKHFALYGYGGDSIWLTEQALREVYLRPFREVFVEGGALGAMTTYQGIGAEHSETTQALLMGVLRGEWQFKGALTTDYIGRDAYCDALFRCGGDLGMGVSLGSLGGVTYGENSSPRVQHRLREAAKHVLYIWLRADYNEQQYLLAPDEKDNYLSSSSINGWVWWKPFVYTVDVCVGTLLGMWAALICINVFMKSPKRKAAARQIVRSGKGEKQ